MFRSASRLSSDETIERRAEVIKASYTPFHREPALSPFGW